MPVDSVSVGIGDSDSDRRDGFYQVDVFVPVDVGAGAALGYADNIAIHFAKGTTLEYNGVYVRISKADIGTTSQEGSHMQTPVLISYLAFTSL